MVSVHVRPRYAREDLSGVLGDAADTPPKYPPPSPSVPSPPFRMIPSPDTTASFILLQQVRVVSNIADTAEAPTSICFLLTGERHRQSGKVVV